MSLSITFIQIVAEDLKNESDDDLDSVISETEADDDSLTTVTSLDNILFDSELLSILDGEMKMCEDAPVITNEKVKT